MVVNLRVENFFKIVRVPKSKWPWYRYNLCVAFCHGMQCLAVIIAICVKLRRTMPNVPYVSGSQELRITNHAMIQIDKEYTKCTDVQNSPMFKQPYKKAFPSDLMDKEHLYDFTNTFAVEYNMPGAYVNTPALICVFFALSCVFQIWNGQVLNHNQDAPRVIHYLEYSLSSSLMMVVLGVNVGIFELYQLIGLWGLFFGMNMFGACAELLCYLVERMDGEILKTKALGVSVYRLWLLPHVAGWGLFLMAFVPVFVKFCISCVCSEPTMPWFVILGVCIEGTFFVLFGCVQVFGLWFRMGAAEMKNKALVECIIGKMDMCNIVLSFVAKTSLAWLLLGPALSVNMDAL